MIGIIAALIIYFVCDAILNYLKKKEEDRQYAIGLFKECLKDMDIDLDEKPKKSRRRKQTDLTEIDKETEEFIMFNDIDNFIK